MADAKSSTIVPSSDTLVVHCPVHGPTQYCIICKHLRDGSGLGYFAIKPEPTEPALAWCEDCDRIFQEERGWSDRADAEADWSLVCANCYDQILSRHTLQSWVLGNNPEDVESPPPKRCN